MAKLSVIIPCYFNEDNIPVTIAELVNNETRFLQKVEFEYVFVDDGSGDNTYRELVKVKEIYPEKVKVVKLARNVGSYNAIVAGLEYATGDCFVIISADLQDPPELMTKMYEYWQGGFKLVIGSRQERNDQILNKLFANLFHFIMRKIAFKKLPKGGFDYLLFDRVIRNNIVELKEPNSNIMYLIAWLGYDFVNVPYIRLKRNIGQSRWTFKKKFKLMIDSILSFSYFPVRVISNIGYLLGVSALTYGLYGIIVKFTGSVSAKDWSFLMLVVLFVSSFQMIAIGVIGEYVWRALDVSRKRPLYIIDEVI